MTSTARPSLDAAGILSIRIFVAVAEAQSFSEAARQLRLSPSVITNHVSSLEQMLKAALFHRTTRKVAITEAGERFYRQSLSLLGKVDETLALLMPTNDPTGHLRVTAPPSFAVRVLGPRISRFLDAHDGVSVDLIVSSAMPDMIADRIDVALLLRQELDAKMAHTILSPNPRAFCATPAYFARHGTPTTPRELVDHRCLSNMVASAAEPWAVMIDGGMHRVHVTGPLLSDNGLLLLAACMDGVGIGNFYRFHVRDALASGQLVEILATYQPADNRVYAVTPHRQLVRPLVKTFLDFVRAATIEATS